MDLGAHTFLDFKTDNMPADVKNLTNGYGAHAVICLASSKAAYAQALSLLCITGTLVSIGLGQDDLPISTFMVLLRGLKTVGSSVGTSQQADELLQMAVRKEVVPIVKVYEFEKLDEVLTAVEKGQVSGRVVVKLPQ